MMFGLLKNPKRTAQERLNRKMREGSPPYHYNVGTLGAGVSVDFDIATNWPEAKKYEPLDNCLIINDDVVSISVCFNGQYDVPYIVPSGSVRRISRGECGAIWQCRVTNLHAATAITANLIDLELRRAPEDADSLAMSSI